MKELVKKIVSILIIFSLVGMSFISDVVLATEIVNNTSNVVMVDNAIGNSAENTAVINGQNTVANEMGEVNRIDSAKEAVLKTSENESAKDYRFGNQCSSTVVLMYSCPKGTETDSIRT